MVSMPTGLAQDVHRISRCKTQYASMTVFGILVEGDLVNFKSLPGELLPSYLNPGNVCSRETASVSASPESLLLRYATGTFAISSVRLVQ